MKQVTLVAGYGTKCRGFAGLLERCCAKVGGSSLHACFRPYDLEQIHGTLVGMERAPDDRELINANLLTRTGRRVPMDFSRLMEVLRRHLPMRIRFGGFGFGERPFLSAGLTPYERSFQVQWSTSRCTLIGWPHEGGDFTGRRIVNDLRDELAKVCGLGHKYHGDNDFFVVLGLMVAPAGRDGVHEAAASKLEEELRAFLSAHPFDLELTLRDLSIMVYDDVTLPLKSTTRYPVAELALNSDWVRGLYG